MPNTHYLFSAGRDGLVKYWDADRWELLLQLEGHKAEVRLFWRPCTSLAAMMLNQHWTEAMSVQGSAPHVWLDGACTHLWCPKSACLRTTVTWDLGSPHLCPRLQYNCGHAPGS